MQEHARALVGIHPTQNGGADMGLSGGDAADLHANLEMCGVWSGVETWEWFHPELTHTDNTHSLQQQSPEYCVSIQGLQPADDPAHTL